MKRSLHTAARMHESDRVFISHAGIARGASNPFDPNNQDGVVWTRQSLKKLGKIQIVGHTPTRSGLPEYDARSNSWYIDGNAGAIALNATGNLTTGGINLRSEGSGTGGNLSLESRNGSIDTSAGTISAFSANNSGGSVVITAQQNIVTGTIESSVGQAFEGRPVNANSGTISITSLAGGINTSAGLLDSRANNGNSGAITLRARGDIITGSIASLLYQDAIGTSGNISLTSETGSINTTAGILDTGVTFGNSGQITLNAANNITIGNIKTQTPNGGVANSGNLFITSSGGAIDTSQGTIFTNSDNGNGGAIALNASSNIITGAINTSSGGSGTGGNITITSSNASVNTNAGTLNTSSQSGAGGDITLQAGSNGNIVAATLDAGGATRGGNIRLIGDEIDYISILSTGALTFEPATAATPIRIGDTIDTGAGILDLTAEAI